MKADIASFLLSYSEAFYDAYCVKNSSWGFRVFFAELILRRWNCLP